MTRNEQVKQAAISYANKSIRDKGIAYLEFIEAVEWADATLIEKACRWLLEGGYFVNNTETIDDFRRAMEE